MKARYAINGLTFKTKAALIEHCRAILKRDAVTSDEEIFLRALLEQHPERDLKVGCGVTRIYIDSDGGFGGRCFWLERGDGSKTDFSFRSCITPPTHEAEVRAAFRQHITDQIIRFRDTAFRGADRVPCAITGEFITNDQAHVDHQPPQNFKSLVDAFLLNTGLTLDGLSVKPTTDASTSCELADAVIETKWRMFHEQHAVLRIVSKRANLSQGQGR